MRRNASNSQPQKLFRDEVMDSSPRELALVVSWRTYQLTETQMCKKSLCNSYAKSAIQITDRSDANHKATKCQGRVCNSLMASGKTRRAVGPSFDGRSVLNLRRLMNSENFCRSPAELRPSLPLKDWRVLVCQGTDLPARALGINQVTHHTAYARTARG